MKYFAVQQLEQW